MKSIDVLRDGYGRIPDALHAAVAGLSTDQLATPVEPGTNTIAWLLWHLTRVQDEHVADVSGVEEVWASGGWQSRFALPFERDATGYGQDAEAVASVRVSGDLLAGYYDAVHAQTQAYLSRLADDDLDRVVDTRWDPPVTLGVRLVSVLDDDLQHVGQAALLHGILTRRIAG